MDFEKNYNETYPESLKGYFLISESNMSDPNFYQTVVLILEHNHEGAFGLVVNRCSKLTLGDVMPDYQNERGYSCPIYVGGPVQQEYIFVLHSDVPGVENSESSIKPVEGVVFEPSFRKLENYFNVDYWKTLPIEDRPDIHIFLGFSGWAPGQLENEMKQGAWVIHKASARIVFHKNPEEGWKDALRDKGGIYKIFADSKQSPHLN
ncbi:MAG: YqgE/AlgH family protein [Spirochaetia bacterium]|nr:YqgE/AlgH family protein [Spirochaetia bacterium]